MIFWVNFKVMVANKCLICGSSSIRADRALHGRLVCNSCGTPLGVGKRGNKKITNYSKFLLNKKFFLFVFLFIFSVILVFI